MTSVLDPPAAAPASSASADGGLDAAGSDSARLRLRPRHAGAATGFVDGGWWPRTNELAAELPELLAQMQGAGYRTTRVTYNLDFWAPTPRRLTIDGQVIRLGGFRSQSAAVLVLVDSATSRRTELLVIAPDMSPEQAEHALTLASTAADNERADEIIAAA